MNCKTGIALYALWVVGFFAAGCGYYHAYREAWPSFGRVIAAMFWPIGIPLDYVFIVRRWPQKMFGLMK